MLHRLSRYTAGALIAVLAVSAPAVAQFTAASNVVVKGGITPGFTHEGQPGVTNGTLRWNPTTTNHEAWTGSEWRQVGSGDITVTNGPKPEAVVVQDTNGTYYLDYVPRATVQWTDWLAEHSTSNRLWTYPGRLLYYSVNGNTYETTNTINHTNYYPHFGSATNTPPLPTDTRFFRLFVAKGATGASGIGTPGADGAAGIGNVNVGIYDPGFTYDATAGTNWWVSYGGQIYQLVNTNGTVTGLDPTTTNWTVVLEKGTSGTLVGMTNLIDRGDWSALVSYTTNDYVRYDGNLFVVYTNLASLNQTPSVDANHVGEDSPYWDVMVKRGSVGATGATGADGNTINIYNYDLIFTNTPINSPSNGYHIIAWVGTNAGGTNLYAFVDYIPVGTNYLNASNGVLWLNGAEYSPGASGDFTNSTVAAGSGVAVTATTNASGVVTYTVSGTGGAIPAELADLSDVSDLSGASSGDVLTKDASGTWTNAPPSGGSGSSAIDWFTNQYAMIGYTDAVGQVQYPFDDIPADVADSADWVYTFDGVDSLTHSNIGSWGVSQTNGRLVIDAPNESVSQPRMFCWRAIASGTPVRVAARFSSPLIQAWTLSPDWAMGVGMWENGTGTFNVFGVWSADAAAPLKWMKWTSAFSISLEDGVADGFITGYDHGTPNTTVNQYGDWPMIFAADHDGVLTMRSYIGNNYDSLVLIGIKTNVPPPVGVFITYTRRMSSQTNLTATVDHFLGKEGAGWYDFGTY